MNAPLFVLATRPQAPPHQCGAQDRIPPRPELGRGFQVERACTRCGVVKITAFPDEGGGMRLWRLPGETAQRPDDPGCVSDEEMMGRADEK